MSSDYRQIMTCPRSSEPLLLVNGAEVALTGGVGESSPVMTYLNNLNPKNIDFIEILKGGDGANYGLRGGNGVILVNLSNKSIQYYYFDYAVFIIYQVNKKILTFCTYFL